MSTHRHKKRGTTYTFVGYGKMQVEKWEDHTVGFADPISVDMRPVAIYRADSDGSLWVRPREEFEDGRFEVLNPVEFALVHGDGTDLKGGLL